MEFSATGDRVLAEQRKWNKRRKPRKQLSKAPFVLFALHPLQIARVTSINHPPGDIAVGVDAAVAEEGPVLTGYFDEFGVEVGVEGFFFVVAG